jgi:predicted RNA-binding protein with PIN domain
MPARREILIDAYNVMFAHPSIAPLLRRDAERARDEFLALVDRTRPPDGTRTVVVFDAHRSPAQPASLGRTGSEYRKGLHVVYARDSADAWIMERIRTHEDPRVLSIVTSDREILDTVRAHGATILRVSEFLNLPRKQHQRVRDLHATEKPEHESPRQIDDWEKLFREPRDEE